MIPPSLPTEVDIREEADTALLAQLHATIFTDPWHQAWNAAAFQSVFSIPGTRAWILRKKEAPIGFALANLTLDQAEIFLIGLVPAERRHGYGGHLLDYICAHMAQKGAKRLFLEYAEGNAGAPAAAALYAQKGFQPIGRRAHYYGDHRQKWDACLLARDLIPLPVASIPSGGGY